MKNLKPVKTVMSFNTSSKLEILSTLLSGLDSIDLVTLLVIIIEHSVLIFLESFKKVSVKANI